MNITLTKDEVALVLDALAQLPLARSYNLFNRLAQQLQEPSGPQQPDPAAPHEQT
jgi:hypothetical protein